MLKKIPLFILLAGAAFAQRRVALGDWPDQRGPDRDGVSKETGLPEKWTLNGDGMLWRAAYGGGAAPGIMGEPFDLPKPLGPAPGEQETGRCPDPEPVKTV